LEIEDAIAIATADQFEALLAAQLESARGLWIAIVKKSTGRHTVGIDELIESGLCWGWVDVKTKRIDDERYGIRFTPRRPWSNWTPRNREIACRLIAEGRMRPQAIAKLPPDLNCT
jgi:uncharacterized protein YdeI (YjbR/CyaY-like superfamily)